MVRWLILAFLVASVDRHCVDGQSVTAPAAGVTVTVTETTTVTWSKVPGDSVRLGLVRPGTPLVRVGYEDGSPVLFTTVPNTGSYQWLVPHRLLEYNLPITAAVEVNYSQAFEYDQHVVSGFFYLDKPSVVVEQPYGGELFAPQDLIVVRWSGFASLGPYVRLRLGAFMFINGEYNWVGLSSWLDQYLDAAAGTYNYTLTAEARPFWDSKFRITVDAHLSMTPGSYISGSRKSSGEFDYQGITVLEPSPAQLLYPTQMYEISWNTNMAGSVISISLQKAGMLVAIVSANTDSRTESLLWDIPSNLTPGIDYKLLLQDIENMNVFGEQTLEIGALTVCSAGQHISSPATATTDRSCDNCTAGSTFSATDNAAVCSNVRVCDPGTYVTADPSVSVDRECTACANGTFATSSNQAECSALRTCEAGTKVLIPGNSTTDQECIACLEGTFQPGQNQPGCLTATICEAGGYIVVEPTTSTDRSCDNCTAGSTFSKSHNLFNCSAIQDCGVGEYVWLAATVSDDRQCRVCEAGSFNNFTNVGHCINHTVCMAEHIETISPTASSDRLCVPAPAVSNPSGSKSFPWFIPLLIVIVVLVLAALFLMGYLHKRRLAQVVKRDCKAMTITSGENPLYQGADALESAMSFSYEMETNEVGTIVSHTEHQPLSAAERKRLSLRTLADLKSFAPLTLSSVTTAGPSLDERMQGNLFPVSSKCFGNDTQDVQDLRWSDKLHSTPVLQDNIAYEAGSRPIMHDNVAYEQSFTFSDVAYESEVGGGGAAAVANPGYEAHFGRVYESLVYEAAPTAAVSNATYGIHSCNLDEPVYMRILCTGQKTNYVEARFVGRGHLADTEGNHYLRIVGSAKDENSAEPIYELTKLSSSVNDT